MSRYDPEYYQARKEAGLCVHCGRKAAFGSVQCEHHLKEKREAARARRQKAKDLEKENEILRGLLEGKEEK